MLDALQSLKERLKRHFNKEVRWTKDRLPVTLITYVAFNDRYKAFDFERYLKSGSGKGVCEETAGLKNSQSTHD